MSRFYLVPASWLLGGTGSLPVGPWHSSGCPDGIHALIKVEHWNDTAAEEAWENNPDVLALPEEWDWGKQVPQAVAAMFRQAGVSPGDTMAQAAQRIRAITGHSLRAKRH